MIFFLIEQAALGVLGVVKNFQFLFIRRTQVIEFVHHLRGYKVVQRTVDKENGHLGLSHALAHICLFQIKPGQALVHLI